MRMIKTSQFAKLYLLGEKFTNPNPNDVTSIVDSSVDAGNPGQPSLTEIGFASTIRISEDLGSSQRNVLGTPVPIFIPGYYQGTASIERATVDGQGFKTISSINPYTAYRPDSYNIDNNQSALRNGLDVSNVNLGNGETFIPPDAIAATGGKIPRFLFGLFLYDTILDGTSKPVGVYVCMLRNYDVPFSSNDSVIMENISAIVRPVQGSWLGTIKDFFNLNPAFGYVSGINGQK